MKFCRDVWSKHQKVFLDINYNLFPFLWMLAFFTSILDLFTYEGFSFKHLFLPLQPLIYITFVSGMVSRVFLEISESSDNYLSNYKTLLTVNRLAFLPMFFSSILINSLEFANYPNYIFSTLHIHPDLIIWPMSLNIFLIIISLRYTVIKWILEEVLLVSTKEIEMLKSYHMSVETPNKLSKSILVQSERVLRASYVGFNIILRIVIVVFVLWGFTKNVSNLYPWMFERSSYMIKNPLATYKEKMRYGWKDFYDYMTFVDQVTPENAKIMLPPMINPWWDVGGKGLVRYFLYPRELMQDMEDVNAEIDLAADYLLLTWGFGVCTENDPPDCYGWPKKIVEAEWIVFKKENSEEVGTKIENIVYDHNDEIYQGAWGVIKIKK